MAKRDKKVKPSTKAPKSRGPAKRALDGNPKPLIKRPKALVKNMKMAISGANVSVMKDDAPAVADGRILEQEGMGIIKKSEGGALNFGIGAHILISCGTQREKCPKGKNKMHFHSDTQATVKGMILMGNQVLEGVIETARISLSLDIRIEFFTNL